MRFSFIQMLYNDRFTTDSRAVNWIKFHWVSRAVLKGKNLQKAACRIYVQRWECINGSNLCIVDCWLIDGLLAFANWAWPQPHTHSMAALGAAKPLKQWFLILGHIKITWGPCYKKRFLRFPAPDSNLSSYLWGLDIYTFSKPSSWSWDKWLTQRPDAWITAPLMPPLSPCGPSPASKSGRQSGPTGSIHGTKGLRLPFSFWTPTCCRMWKSVYCSGI